MALQIKVTTSSGLVVERAYARVDSRTGGNKSDLVFTLNYYIDAEAFTQGKPYFMQELYSFIPSVADDAPNDIKQCYGYVKESPGFEGAIDC